MLKALKYGTLAALFALTAGFGPAAAQKAPAPSVSPEERQVYEAVLKSWLGAEGGKQLINERLGPPPAMTDLDASCLAGARFGKTPAGPRKTLAGVTFERAGLQLIDGDRWKPRDPEDRLSSGNVDALVKEAFAHSLITLSQIAFSQDGRDALVDFGMVCGRLCGNGSTLRMHKSAGGWTVLRRCGGWIS